MVDCLTRPRLELAFRLRGQKVSVEWHSSARHGDTIQFELAVTRWGSSSFDVRIGSAVGGRPVVTIDLVYVSVAPGSHTPTPVPADIRDLLSRGGGS